MVLHQFPDLTWLKQQVARKFSDRNSGQAALPQTGWPTVILHAQVQEIWRPEIRGTLSLFLNRSGKSRCTAGGHTATVGESTYFISNEGQSYSLEIDAPRPVETFNIHVSEQLLRGFFTGQTLPHAQLLDRPAAEVPLHFFNRLHRRDSAFDRHITHIQALAQKGEALEIEETMTGLLQHLLGVHHNLLRRIEQLPATKAATRAELYRRLSLALDYLHSCYDQQLDLESLAQVACLSKHHFLRLFRATFGQTPHQHLTTLRMEKACKALQGTDLPIFQIALETGFENSSSFSRLFFQRMGRYPSQYRSQN